MTQKDAIERLKELAREIAELTQVLERAERDPSAPHDTAAFLNKCGGWEDDRSVEEIVADIRAARVDSVGMV